MARYVGYGDMTPLHPVARMLSDLEAVFAQLYLAVLIAGLMGRRSGAIAAGQLEPESAAPSTLAETSG